MNELGQSVASAHNQNESNNELTMSGNSSPCTSGSKFDVGLLAHEDDAEIEGRIKNFLENNGISVMKTADAKIPGNTRTQMPFQLVDDCQLVVPIATPKSMTPGYSRYYVEAAHDAALRKQERENLPKIPFHVLRPHEHLDISIAEKFEVCFSFVENDNLGKDMQQMLRELGSPSHCQPSFTFVDHKERGMEVSASGEPCNRAAAHVQHSPTMPSIPTDQTLDKPYIELKNISGVKPESNGGLGKGAYGIVKLVFLKNKDPVAIKCYSLLGSDKTREKNMKSAEKELSVMFKSKHENIVALKHYTKWQENGAIGIIMEYMAGGNLSDIVIKEYRENYEIPCILNLRFCLDIANGLKYLHCGFDKKRVAHGDIKPDNILLTADLRCKIGDFGCSEFGTCTSLVTSKREGESRPYSSAYAAPERRKNKRLRPSTAMDIYSFGAILVEILTQKIIQYFLNDKDNIDIESVLESFCRIKSANDIITVIQEALKTSCRDKPDQRPSIDELQQSFDQCFTGQSDAKMMLLDQSVRNIVKLKKVEIPRHEDCKCAPMNEFLPEISFRHIKS
ncbi:uncharacterized protein LOC143446385 [Clavelina lepadiformis]|uniref:uncharacterized protein LOC143446385 n=1 Tax=Clavelina lepadiformis TaxID=159417 RepID=UPI004043182D